MSVVLAPSAPGVIHRGGHRKTGHGTTAHRKASHRRAAGPKAHASHRALRIAGSVLAVGMSAAVIRENISFRVFEAWLAGHVIPLATAIRAGSVPGAPIIWFADGPHLYRALLITPDCTVATLMVPFLLVTGWTIWHQARLARPVTAFVLAVSLLIAVNQLRLLAITWLILLMGFSSGFYWGHTMVGSLITVFGMVGVFFASAMAAAQRSSRRRGAPAPPGAP